MRRTDCESDREASLRELLEAVRARRRGKQWRRVQAGVVLAAVAAAAVLLRRENGLKERIAEAVNVIVEDSTPAPPAVDPSDGGPWKVQTVATESGGVWTPGSGGRSGGWSVKRVPRGASVGWVVAAPTEDDLLAASAGRPSVVWRRDDGTLAWFKL